MPERLDAPEGWDVRQKFAILAALGTVTTLVVLLVVAGYFYDRELRPETHRPYATFPAPGIETAIHAGANDPHLPTPVSPTDPAIAAAKREIAANGLPGWERQP
jgi:hypothetical protein